MKAAILLTAAALSCLAQKLEVYSELTRIDPFGEIVPMDRGAPPRHILSPGVPRNAYSSLRVVVRTEVPANYHLDIAQNPDNAVKTTLYREVFGKHGEAWIPDKLEPVKIPYEGVATDFRIPGQKVVTFWLDMWVDGNAEVDRIKVEPQLWATTTKDWVIYPMEVRILETVIPNVKVTAAALPEVTEPADAAVKGPIRQVLCNAKEPEGTVSLTARAMIRRNTLQHLTLARPPTRLEAALKAAGVAVCAESEKPKTGPEWYLRVRDALFRPER